MIARHVMTSMSHKFGFRCPHQKACSVSIEGRTLIGITLPAVMDNGIPIRERLVQASCMCVGMDYNSTA